MCTKYRDFGAERADARKHFVSGLALRDAGWTLVIDDDGCRLVHRESGEYLTLLERAGIPVLPFRP